MLPMVEAEMTRTIYPHQTERETQCIRLLGLALSADGVIGEFRSLGNQGIPWFFKL
jgi:hypothetical protein